MIFFLSVALALFDWPPLAYICTYRTFFEDQYTF